MEVVVVGGRRMDGALSRIGVPLIGHWSSSGQVAQTEQREAKEAKEQRCSDESILAMQKSYKLSAIACYAISVSSSAKLLIQCWLGSPLRFTLSSSLNFTRDSESGP